jgi:hypothetical protein
VLTRGRPNVKIVSRLQEVVCSDEHISLESTNVPSVGQVLLKDVLHLGRGVLVSPMISPNAGAERLLIR